MNSTHPTLLEGQVAPQVRGLAVPLAWGLLAMTVFNVADTWFIARLGTAQLAAFGFAIPVTMFFMGVIFGPSVGTTSALSRVYGSGDIEKMRQMSTDALTLTFLLVCAVATAGLYLIDDVFRMLGASEALLPMIHDFMSYWYLAMPFLSVMMIGNSCIRATGDTKFPSSMMILTTVITLVLDPFFIFGWAGIPRMELKGAGVVLLIAFTISCSVSLYRLIFRKKILTSVLLHAGIVESWKKILHVGIPSIVSNQIGPISLGVITWMAAGYGREAVAALGVANRIENFVTIVFYSLGAGVSIFSGQNYGAGNYGRVQEATAIAARWCIVWGLMCFAVLASCANIIPPLFDANPDVILHAAQYLHWIPVSYGALGVMIICNAVFNATGKPIPATAIIFLKAIVIYIPLAYVLQKKMGFQGIVVALMTTNFIMGAVAYIWHKKANA